MLMNNKDFMFSLSLKKDSDYLNIIDRQLSNNFKADSLKLLSQIHNTYKKAEMFPQVFPLIEKILNYDDTNLFYFVKHSLEVICDYLDIKTPLVVSSTLEYDNNLKSQDKVIAICNAYKYINPIGGTGLYDTKSFAAANIKLSFIKPNDISYNQFQNEFIPFLSILDVIMFNSKEQIMSHISNFKLV
jgi:hypothetical protein